MFTKLTMWFTNLKKNIVKHSVPARSWAKHTAKKRPFTSLFSLLALLVVFIIISNFLSKPKETVVTEQLEPKKVQIYTIGSAPRITVQAQVEKSGVVTITALSPGVVQRINVEPGSDVYRGNTLISMSTTYQGGNAPALQLQLAGQQLQNANDTYDSQKDLIQKQRDLANKGDENTDQLRDITKDSIDETQAVIDLNNTILETINANIDAGTNVDTNRQLKSQYLSANNQLKAALRNAQYQAPSDKPPAELSNIQKDIALKQLDLQEKALTLSREVARLQYQIAAVQAQAMAPSAPFNARVQRVHVKIGEAVNPGDALVTLSQAIEDDPIVAIAYVPREVAQKVNYYEPSTLTLGTVSYDAYPTYITRDAIKGTLYGVYFAIPDNYHSFVADNGYINVQIPVGMAQTSAAVPFIPIDSVYQTQDSSYIFIAKKGRAESRVVKLGPVIGSYVEVESGIDPGDVIILDRNIVSGQRVSTK